jgi:hypothetical protein
MAQICISLSFLIFDAIFSHSYMVLAALTEELVKSAGFVGIITNRYPPLTWKCVLLSSLLIGFGFLVGEKLLLVVTISQIVDSIFGAALFLSFGLIWIPFLLHAGTVCCTGVILKRWGMRALPVGIIIATALHTLYNLYVLRGGCGESSSGNCNCTKRDSKSSL